MTKESFKKIVASVLVTVAAFLFATPSAFAAVTVTAATGGSAISADTNTTNGVATWTTLTGPTITEATSRAISTGSGTIVLTRPSGFSFSTSTAVTATITRDAGSGSCFTFSSNTVTPTSSTITYTLTARDSNGSTRCHVTFSSIQVRPTAGTPLASGNITNTGSNASVPSGATDYGTLTEVAGAKNKLAYTTQPSTTATTSVDFTTKPVITLQDQYGNTRISDSASTITLSPVLSSQVCGGTAGSGTLSSTPASGAAVTAGVMTYTAMQYSFGEAVKICAISAGVTSALSNTVTVNNPIPTTSSISPTSTAAGGTQFTLTVNGTNFVSNSVVDWNGSPRTTTFGSANQVTATITAADIAAAGIASVKVVNPAPGGGTSNVQTFTVIHAVPTLASISPTSTNLGGGNFTLTLTGSGFDTSSTVDWGGSSRATTFVSSTQLTATILSTDIAVSGTHSVTVVNPTPGGGTSASQTFTVEHAAPTLTSVSPTSTTAGGSQFTLTLVGTGFDTSSTVQWNGSSRATTFVSSVQLTATITAGDIASAGTSTVTVVNPTPGGGTSNALTFTILAAASKFVILNPGGDTAGTPLTVTVQAQDSGSNLVSTYNGGVTLVATGTSVTGGGVVNIINGVGTSTVSTNVAQTVGLTLSDTQSTGFNVSSSQFVTFAPGPISAFTLNHPGSISTGARAAYVVGRKDQYNNPTSVSSTVVYLYSNSTSTTKSFFDAATGGNQISSTTIQAGSTSTLFWYYETIGGTYTITASDNSTAPDGAAGIADATDNVTVAPGAVKFVFANAPASANAGDTVTFNVEAVDSFGAVDTSFNQDVTVTKTGSGAPTGGGLVTIINGMGTSTVSDTLAETVSLALQDTQLTGLNVSSTASVVFSAGPATQFSLNHPGNMNTGTRLGYTVSRKDQYNNPTSVSSTVVYLYSNSTSTTKSFFDAATGGNQISSTTIQAGSTSTLFWYYETIGGTYTITASDNSTAPDGAAGIADATDNVTVAPGAVKFVFANAPASANAGDTVTFNVEAVDSFGAVDTSFNQDVTVTKTGSASGGGLVNLVSGVATVTITDITAENVALGLQDTQSTGLGVTSVATIAFLAAPTPASASASGAAAPQGAAQGVKPGINITFSGWVYPGASISLVRKDLGLAQAPVLQTASGASDGSFAVNLNNITRLTGQTYLLIFADENGTVSETKAYNIAQGLENLVNNNMVIAPTVGFSGNSVVSKGKPIVIQGYATPQATVTVSVDGTSVGTVTVNNVSGQYRYVLDTNSLATGRHSVGATQTYDKIQSDNSSQQSFTVSPLANPKLDLNGDGVIDIKDVSIYLSYLKNLAADATGYHTTDPNLLRVLDLNGDGKIDAQDISILLHATKLQ